MVEQATPGDNLSRQVRPTSTAEGLSMLQWKPRIYAVLSLAALVLAAFGGYAGDAGGDILHQFGW
jgi:hypothetical protein